MGISAAHLEWDFLFMYALYSALLAFFLVLTLPYWLLQMMRHGKYRAGLRQRFGETRQSGRNGAEPLAQPRPILAVPHHLQQPIGQRQHQEESEQRTVERIHEKEVPF